MYYVYNLQFVESADVEPTDMEGRLWDLSILRFWYSWRVLELISVDIEGRWYLSFLYPPALPTFLYSSSSFPCIFLPFSPHSLVFNFHFFLSCSLSLLFSLVQALDTLTH